MNGKKFKIYSPIWNLPNYMIGILIFQILMSATMASKKEISHKLDSELALRPIFPQANLQNQNRKLLKIQTQ